MSEERRFYYRVTDSAWIKHTVLNGPSPITDPYAGKFNVPDELKLIAQMASVDRDYEALPRTLSDEQAKGYHGQVERLERKIEHINQFITLQLVKQLQFDKQHVSLSESGMSLNSPDSLSTGTVLHLILLLPLTLTALAVFATVRHRKETTTGGGYLYGLQFDHLAEADRQRLAKHIIHKQSVDIQALRRASAQDA